ncbi:MAG: hypothetical protein OK449_05120 [Thaumarchaeota archaeon]|nr:hypothetical protein [Nitrososphaerota archaeon]
MGNTIPGTVTKLLTLIPIVVVVYYFDFSKFLTVFTTAGQGAFFAVATSLFVLGVVLKRRILSVRLELSRVSFTWGLPLLFAAGFLYIYGSFAANSVWYYYESLCALIIGYVAVRIGTGILRALAPLLAILVLAFPLVGFFAGVNDRLVVVILSSDLIFVFFLVFVGLRMKAIIIPSVVVLLGLFAWYKSPFPLLGHQVDLLLLVPIPLVALLVPKIRRSVSLPNGAPALTCSEHSLLPDGFCSICGLKLARAKTTENFGPWGLVAVLAVAALILLASVPALVLVNNVPYDAHYSSSGYSATVTPPVPSGWQINSTTLYTKETDSYAIKQVYVPLYHPETENYTMYYELSFGPLVSHGPNGSDISNFKTGLSVLQQFGPFYGSLISYTAPGKVMLAYQGKTTMLFYNASSGFGAYSVGVGFVREFDNTNVSSDSSQFLGDLNALWLPAFTTDAAYSGWDNTLYALDQAALSLNSFLLLAASVMGMGWLAYRAGRSDDRLDRFLNLASAQPEEYWAYLSRLLNRSHRMGTGEEISLVSPGTQMSDTGRVDSSLRELERRRLVRRSLVERGADIVSVWRPTT